MNVEHVVGLGGMYAQSEFTYVEEENVANLSAFWGQNQEEEANQIVDKIECLLNAEPTTRIAILCRGRNLNSSRMCLDLILMTIRQLCTTHNCLFILYRYSVVRRCQP